MNRVVSFVVVGGGGQEDPDTTVHTIQMALWMQRQYIEYSATIGGAHGSGSSVYFCHPAIYIPRDEIDSSSPTVKIREGWHGIAELRRADPFFTIVGYHEDSLTYPPVHGIAYVLIKLDSQESDCEVLLLIDERGSKTSLGDLPIKRIKESIDYFYSEPYLSLIVSEDHQFAFIRRRAVRELLGEVHTRWRIRSKSSGGIRGFFKRHTTRGYVIDLSQPPEDRWRQLGALYFQLEEQRLKGDRPDFEFIDLVYIGSKMFELQLARPDEYAFSDLVWALHFQANLKEHGVRVIPQRW